MDSQAIAVATAQLAGTFSLAGVVVGGILGGIVTWLATRANIQSQAELQRERFAREDRGARNGLLPALLNLYELVYAAAWHSQFNAARWREPLDDVLARVGSPDTARAFSEREWHSIALAAYECRLTRDRLTETLGAWHPFSERLDRPQSDIDEEQIRYVSAVRGMVDRAYDALVGALRECGIDRGDDKTQRPKGVDLVNEFRMGLGQPMMR